ncbi:putative cation channel sperm-associated protein 2-like [Apostichopus japonicus]|uniref:Putative cation channel sperm-associated protein 2-like n=1 Tax=Stichopus japonicus TaxID=307972 RepID=A0A2G8L8Y3_STIJA|nr:putative cation channel sperm-associated protein 2-like [Apostichopus japonicus]
MAQKRYEENLSPYAELFRSKLIEDFHLLESFDEHGKSDAPKYYSKDFEDPARQDKMMLENPHGLVKFQVYSRKEPGEHFMLVLILSNSIALGLQAEVSESDDPKFAGLKLALDIFDYCSLFLFMVEIILKWIDNFWSFWSDNWNIFDFAVTVGSFVPEIINFFAGDIGGSMVRVIVRNLRVFRILRSLKMVSRFRQVRLIALAIGKAFSAITFIMLLLFTFLYIFAITGIIFFDTYTRSERQDLKYKDSFRSLPRAMITLFQLFTLDQWYKLLNDMWKVMDSMIPLGYIILWICIGSFIFRNVFVGIMVNNFQSIRNDLFEEVKEQEAARQIIQDTEKFNEELSRQEKKLNANRRGTLYQSPTVQPPKPNQPQPSQLAGLDNSETDEQSVSQEDESNTDGQTSLSGTDSYDLLGESSDSLFRRSSDGMIDKDKLSTNWEKTVHDNLTLLTSTPSETLWPRDTLFRYFQLMESLMENLQERQDLQDLAYHSLLQIFDSFDTSA